MVMKLVSQKTPNIKRFMEQPIFSCECVEKEGTVIRSVYPLIHTRESINKFWSKVKDLKTVFSHQFFGDFDKFTATFFTKDANDLPKPQGLFWVIDDFIGVFYLTDIYPGADATAHYLFFDRIHFGRENLSKEMLRYLINYYKFHRLSVELPNYASITTRRFITNIGFVYEGKKRQSKLLNDVWYDANIYGLLKKDLKDE